MKHACLSHAVMVLALTCAVPHIAPAFAVESAHAGEADPLTLDAAAIRTAGIQIATLGTRTMSDELKAPAEVRADAYSTVLVTPRVESLVLSRHVRLGEVVRKGQPLVTLSSVAVAEVQGVLIVAEQDWQRIAQLGPQAVSGRRYAEAKVARDVARAKLRAYGLGDAQIGALLRKGSTAADGSFALLAPVAGRIASDDFLVGARVEPGSTLFTLVEEGTVWVVAQVPPREAERIASGAVVRIDAHGETLAGKVIGRAHLTDERTRTVPVRIAVDNRKDLLHPGELVDARIVVGRGVMALAVPDEAVVLLQNQPTVFVDKGHGRFEGMAVLTGESRGGWTPIRQGLAAGTRYVRSGAFALKARLLRAQLGEH